MLYNVYDYSNQIIGQVEASSAVEAWPIAGRNFSEHQILDVRLVEFAGQIPPKFRGSPKPKVPEGTRLLVRSVMERLKKAISD